MSSFPRIIFGGGFTFDKDGNMRELTFDEIKDDLPSIMRDITRDIISRISEDMENSGEYVCCKHCKEKK